VVDPLPLRHDTVSTPTILSEPLTYNPESYICNILKPLALYP